MPPVAKSSSVLLRYKAPIPAFVPVVGTLLLLLHLVFACEVSPDGKSLIIPRHLAEREAAQFSNAGQHASLSHKLQMILHRDIQPFLFAVGKFIFRSMDGIRYVAYAAIAAHVGEATYALSKCLSLGASSPLSVTLRYVVGVFIGGFTQLVVLKAQIKKLQRN